MSIEDFKARFGNFARFYSEHIVKLQVRPGFPPPFSDVAAREAYEKLANAKRETRKSRIESSRRRKRNGVKVCPPTKN
jgi:hypothetical protein